MRKRSIRAVLFDLGGTLMIPKSSWPPVFERADKALTAALCAQGLEVDFETIHHEFMGRLTEYYTRRDQDLYERTYTSVLRSLLVDKGYTDVPEQVIRSALDAMYAVTQSNWVLINDAISTLKILEAEGYRLGILSNAGDNKDVFQLAEGFHIEIFFDFILTSAACSYRKPHPRIFEVALAHWRISPQDAAMVGDDLDADISGANGVGIFSILVTNGTVKAGGNSHNIQPDATISTLSELPGLLNNL